MAMASQSRRSTGGAIPLLLTALLALVFLITAVMFSLQRREVLAELAQTVSVVAGTTDVGDGVLAQTVRDRLADSGQECLLDLVNWQAQQLEASAAQLTAMNAERESESATIAALRSDLQQTMTLLTGDASLGYSQLAERLRGEYPERSEAPLLEQFASQTQELAAQTQQLAEAEQRVSALSESAAAADQRIAALSESMAELQKLRELPMIKASGTYELDKRTIERAIRQEMGKTEIEDEKTELRILLGALGSLTMTLTLNANGEAVRVSDLAGDVKTLAGTWYVSGSDIALKLAIPGEEPEVMRGKVYGHAIKFDSPDEEEMPVNLIFKRQESE